MNEDVIAKVAEPNVMIQNRIKDLSELELPPSERMKAYKLEIAYPIARVLSPVEEEYRRVIVENALDIARRVSTFLKELNTANAQGSDE